MLPAASMATTATAPECSTTSRVAVTPPGMSTSSRRSAKILPLCSSCDEVVSKTCSATGHMLRQGIRQPTAQVSGTARVTVRPVFGVDGLVVFVMGLGDLHRQPLGGLVIHCRADERREQWMRSGGPALQLRVRLGTDQERMHLARVLDELHELAVRRGAGEPQPALRDPIPVGDVDLEP